MYQFIRVTLSCITGVYKRLISKYQASKSQYFELYTLKRLESLSLSFSVCVWVCEWKRIETRTKNNSPWTFFSLAAIVIVLIQFQDQIMKDSFGCVIGLESFISIVWNDNIACHNRCCFIEKKPLSLCLFVVCLHSTYYVHPCTASISIVYPHAWTHFFTHMQRSISAWVNVPVRMCVSVLLNKPKLQSIFVHMAIEPQSSANKYKINSGWGGGGWGC